MFKPSSKFSSRKKPILIGLVVSLLLIAILFILEKKQIINLYSKPAEVPTSEAKTTSTAPTAQADFTDGNERPITRNEKQEGLVQDTSGNVPSIPNQSHWSSSADGAITVYSPAKNSLITTGGSITGTSSMPNISFRLIDDVNGVIAQGSLSVVNGKFSGTFNFSTGGTNGRLDFFSAAADGTESSNIEIPVRFK